MQATLNAREADPHDTFVIEPDVVLAARADKPDPQWREPDLRALVSEISAGVAAHSTAPTVDTSFRSVAAQNKRGRWLSRFAVAFLFALVSAVGAAGWQRYGDNAQAYVATVAPSLGFSSPQAASAPASTPVAEPAADQATATAAAVTPATDAAATSAPPSPDQTQQIQSLTRDLAAMGQQIESLKAGIAELTAGQQQLAHDAKAAETKAAEAKAFEQSMRAKVSALAPRAPVTARKPKPYVPPAQAAAAPLLPPPGAPGSVPVQIAPAPPPVSTAPEAELVPRPPMPVR